MMKKLLIFMLVLGMATLANAALQISVNGDPDPVDSQITLAPSETIELDILTDTLIVAANPATWHMIWAMVVDTTVGSMTAPYGGGVILEPYASDGGWTLFQDASGNGQMPEGPGSNGIWGTITPIAADVQPGAVMYNGIIFHCEAPGDAYVSTYSSADGVNWTPQDSVIIHQIPEPMTVLLLGFGGLLLRRRR